ncbi:hypothetical protein AB0J28_46150 [Streptosporangium canum]|uniref:hypothetical protein n=1 Tax=Streptosporangium canum TaxID=324952 RepID=UPI003428BD7B
MLIRISQSIGTLRTAEWMEVWIYQITRNAIADHRRAAVRAGRLRAYVAETFRALNPGGRLGVSDVVAEDRLSCAERAAHGDHRGTAWPSPPTKRTCSRGRVQGGAET